MLFLHRVESSTKAETQIMIRVDTAGAWIKSVQIKPNLVEKIKKILKPKKLSIILCFLILLLNVLKGKETVCPGEAVSKL